MNRQEFLKLCSILGIGFTTQSCNSFSKTNTNNNQNIIVIGAGAAGLTVAHLLQQKGINVQILEANNRFGGRIKTNKNFANFPIPVGAEWLHNTRDVFNKAVNNSDVQIDIQTTPYNFKQDFGLKEGKKVGLKELGFTIDQKFVNATWEDFFAEYILPNIQNNITYNQVVKSIDYSGETIKVATQNNTFTADKVIITVPVKLLQQNTISFTPALPQNKQNAINNVTVWDGLKVFIEFEEEFYPTAVGFDIDESTGHKMLYNASYGQNTNQNILGVFAVGSDAAPYINQTEDEIVAMLLKELDTLFDGKATPNYKKAIVQNWSKEQFAQGAYVHYTENPLRIRTLSKPIENKLYFAGDCYTDGSLWSSVDAAINSAIRTVKKT